MEIYRIEEECVKPLGEKIEINFNEKTKNKKILKIQIDSSISSQIGPKDVLEGLKKCNYLEDEQTIKLKGKEYTITLVKNKTDIFILGKKPNESFNINKNFYGTVHVSQKIVPIQSKFENEVSLQSRQNFKGFHKNVPLGANLDSI